ncbi:MAG: bifunctional precorrin-2 dehydrogenase/sirohydrochlorin ferrochelatase [candidate division Zixibacteria bacterium]|nr:bifunctional precorrin-2 dehydrogenase/sirohydrochlorin ferrochelatase [candidate division Zixibacteria bacterium]
MPNEYLPIGLSVKKKPCLIVGGGNVALRKVETMLDYDTKMTVIAPKPSDKIEYYAERKLLKLEQREYVVGEVSNYGMVIAASDDAEVNKIVADDCNKAGIPINVVDSPSLCDFIFPATIQRDCLTISVLSDGKAPFLSGHLRMILEDLFPGHWTKIAGLATEYRKKVHTRWKGKPQQKADSFERFINADWKKLLKDLNEDELDSELDKLLEI